MCCAVPGQPTYPPYPPNQMPACTSSSLPRPLSGRILIQLLVYEIQSPNNQTSTIYSIIITGEEDDDDRLSGSSILKRTQVSTLNRCVSFEVGQEDSRPHPQFVQRLRILGIWFEVLLVKLHMKYGLPLFLPRAFLIAGRLCTEIVYSASGFGGGYFFIFRSPKPKFFPQ